jgi:uridine kinase
MRRGHECKIVGIAGGSGSGKTTLAIGLYKKYPNKIALMHLDDYFVEPDDAPIVNGMINWDDPATIRFDDLYRDVVSLMHGTSVTVMTKSELYNPGYDPKRRNKIPHVIEPMPVILVEGYLTFHDMHVRELMARKVYLDMPIEESLKRRTKDGDKEYVQKILIPMHKQYIEPSKKYADCIVDAMHLGVDEVRDSVETIIKDWLI